jgi:hypothetical protein
VQKKTKQKVSWEIIEGQQELVVGTLTFPAPAGPITMTPNLLMAAELEIAGIYVINDVTGATRRGEREGNIIQK